MHQIGFDLQPAIGRKTGLGVYTENLYQALGRPDVRQRADFHFELVPFQKRAAGSWNTFQRLFWENVERPFRAARKKLDLLHIPAFAPARFGSRRLLVTVHDLIGMLFPNQKGGASRYYWGRWLPSAIRRASAWIADSEATKKDMIRHLGLCPDKIFVVYPSGHEGFHPWPNCDAPCETVRACGVREKYFIFVGTIEPRKNLSRVIEAFIRFKNKNPRGREYQLVVVGAQDFAHGRTFETILRDKELGRQEVLFTGYLPREDLNGFYAGAEALVFPSLYEGFGIPILEAMASGTPVITSRASSLPEVAGEAAYYVDPLSVEEIATAMTEIAGDPGLRQGLIQKGSQQIRKFSWEKTALGTIAIYQKLIQGEA
ncbi:MAG: glycosyltransferase family 4 protein [Candidatus Omnitrophota bacterium]